MLYCTLNIKSVSLPTIYVTHFFHEVTIYWDPKHAINYWPHKTLSKHPGFVNLRDGMRSLLKGEKCNRGVKELENGEMYMPGDNNICRLTVIGRTVLTEMSNVSSKEEIVSKV